MASDKDTATIDYRANVSSIIYDQITLYAPRVLYFSAFHSKIFFLFSNYTLNLICAHHMTVMCYAIHHSFAINRLHIFDLSCMMHNNCDPFYLFVLAVEIIYSFFASYPAICTSS